MDIPAYGERNLARNLEENDKKILVEPCRVGEREKKFWKSWFEQVKYDFLKTGFTSFDWSKISFDWSKQTEASLKVFKQFRLIEKQIGSIETDKGSQNFEEKHNFWKDRKSVV